jgi:hypothetical protein
MAELLCWLPFAEAPSPDQTESMALLITDENAPRGQIVVLPQRSPLEEMES